MKRILLFSLLVLWTPVAAHAQGDVYFRNRGPDIEAVPKADPPERKQFCREFTGSDQRRDCFLGADSGRRYAAQMGGLKGWEDGYLRGYAWGLYYEGRTYAGDAQQRGQGRASVATLPQFKEGLGKERSVIFEAATAAGTAAVTSLMDEAFKAQQTPDTKLDGAAIPVGPYSPKKDPYSRYVGTDTSLKAAIANAGVTTLSPFRRAQNFELLAEMKTDHAIGNYVFEDGIYKVDPTQWYDLERAVEGWKHSKLAPDMEKRMDHELEDDGFRLAYAHYVRYSYSKEFYRGLDAGTEDGLPLGKKVGGRVGFLEAQRAEFNKRFAQQMKTIHRTAVLEGYRSGWEARVAEHKQPIIKFLTLELYGEIEDGVLAPGEKIGFKARVENRGLVAYNGTALLRGKIVADPMPRQVVIAAFRTVNVDSGLVGRIHPKARPRQNARVRAELGEAKKPITQTVHSVVELTKFQVGELSLSKGTVMVSLTAESQSLTTGSPEITALIAVDGKIKHKVELGKFKASQAINKTIELQDLDPLRLAGGKGKAQIRLVGSGQVLDQRTTPLRAKDPIGGLVRYFDQLAAGRGYVPKGKDRAARTAETRARLVSVSRIEIRKNQNALSNMWKGAPESTVPGKVLKYRTAKGEAASQEYKSLVESLCALESEFTRVRFQKKKSYKALCRRMRAAK